MNTKLLSIRLWEYSCICLFLLFVFVLGSFFPNDYTKSIIRQKTIDEIRKIGFFEPKIEVMSSERFISSMQKCIAFHNLDIRKQDQILERQDLQLKEIIYLELEYGLRMECCHLNKTHQ
jgi:hypothetical protein